MLGWIKIFFFGIMCCSLLLTTGCMTLETQEENADKDIPAISREGAYHKVKTGETLWRIAKTYNVSTKDIAKANNIPKTAKIEKNQLIFIPGAIAAQEIVLDVDKAQNEFIWPIKGKVIKYFHERLGDQVSKGIDIRAQEGDMVKAARMGRVVFADYLSGYGYTVILDHLDGLHSVYAMNSKLLVALDDLVLRNKNIAQVGRSNNVTYLHFEIRKKSIEDNPLYYLP